MNLSLHKVWKSEAIIFCRLQYPRGATPQSGTRLLHNGHAVATISGYVSHVGFFDVMYKTINDNLKLGIYDCTVMMVEDELLAIPVGSTLTAEMD